MIERRLKAAIISFVFFVFSIICVVYGRSFFNFILEFAEIMVYWGICGIISFSFVFSIYLACVTDETYKDISTKYLKKSKIEEYSARKLFYALVAILTILTGIVNYFLGQYIVNACFELFEALFYYSWSAWLIFFFIISTSCIFISDETFEGLFDDSEKSIREWEEQEIIEKYLAQKSVEENDSTSNFILKE